MKTIFAFLARNPWLYVVLAFILLIAAWSAIIFLSVKYGPQQIELRK